MFHSMEHPLSLRILSAFSYGVVSCLITFVNKILLTNLKFPSFMMVGVLEMFATLLIIQVLSWLGKVELPSFSPSTATKIFPIPVLYTLNLICGLGGTQMISLPMLTVLRRFNIPMTLTMEYILLGVVAPPTVILAVVLMVCGACVAALSDLSFNAVGYAFVLVNNAATALNRVTVKKKMETKELGEHGILYYNCLFMLPPTVLLAYATGELSKTISFLSTSSSIPIWVCLVSASICGFLLNYSIIMCIYYNSALTTSCIGSIKARHPLILFLTYAPQNVIVTYGGILLSTDFIFSPINFLGINISVVGGLLYTYVSFRPKRQSRVSSPVVYRPLRPLPLFQKDVHKTGRYRVRQG